MVDNIKPQIIYTHSGGDLNADPGVTYYDGPQDLDCMVRHS